jgi:hypothetical protein
VRRGGFQSKRGALLACLALGALAAGSAGVARGSHLASPSKRDAAPSLFLSPTGNDSGRCTKAAPCLSWNRAYQLAQPGQVVEVAGGAYPGQTIDPRQPLRNKTCSVADRATCVMFVPAAGARVALSGNLVVTGSDVYVKGTARPASGIPTRSRTFNISVSGYTSVEATSDTDWPDHVVLEGIDTSNFAVGGADAVVLRNMDIGPSTLDFVNGDCRGLENRLGLNGASSHEARNVVLEGLLIHNQNRTLAAAENDCHFGALLLISGSGITLRNSVFSQNVVYNIQIQNFVGSPASNVTIENNWFGCPVGQLFEPNGETTCNEQRDLQFSASSRFANWLIRYNSFAGGIGQYNPGETYSNVRIIGNVGIGPTYNMCQPGVTFAYNAWVGGQECTKQDVFVHANPFRSMSPGSEDLSLRPGTKASGLVTGKGADYTLPTDILGQMRPLHTPPDAGASQRETAALVLPTSIGAATVGEKRTGVLTFYGRPRQSRVRHLSAGSAVRVDVYRAHGKSLRVTYDGDKVVGVGTDSPYYSTPSGFGPGSPVGGAAALRGARWVDCRKAFRKPVGGFVVYFATDAKRRTIVDVSMLSRKYDEDCPKHA